MAEIWIVVVPILIADIVNPVLFAFMVYAAGTARPIVNSSAVLLGHTFAYFSAGIVLALGLERISERLANPQFIDYLLSLTIGVLLLWVAYMSGKQEKKQTNEDDKELSPIMAFGFGAIINFIGIPFALPYFAAIDQILKADLSLTNSLAMLLAYNSLYALPFIIVPVLVAIMGKRSHTVLQSVNDTLDRISNYFLPILLLLVGLALVADALFYFATGKSII